MKTLHHFLFCVRMYQFQNISVKNLQNNLSYFCLVWLAAAVVVVIIINITIQR